MKRKQFVQRLAKEGCLLLRSGGRHDVYINPQTGRRQPAARHTEINDVPARHIRKRLGLD